EVGEGRGDVEGSGQAYHGAVVVVGRDRDERRLGHLRDGPQLEDAAAVAHVGIDDVGGTELEGAAEIGARVELLPRHHGNGDLAPALGERLQVGGGHRVRG